LSGDNPRATGPTSGLGKRSHFIDGFEIWYTNSPGGSGGVIDPTAHRFVFLTLLFPEPWGPLNPNDPSEQTFYCPSFDCTSNNSRARLHGLILYLDSPVFDLDGNGIINFSGYADRYGNVVQGCTVPGVNCVPLVIDNVPVGVYILPEGQGRMIEGDISPSGEFWIRYPN